MNLVFRRYKDEDYPHLFENLQRYPDVFSSVVSFLPPEAQETASVNRVFAEARKEALALSDYEKWLQFGTDSYLSREIQKYDSPETMNEKSELVKKIRRSVIEQIEKNRVHLREADWEAIERSPQTKIHELSYDQMEFACQRILLNQDAALVAFFEAIFVTHPSIQEAIDIPPNAEIAKKAGRIRDWLKTDTAAPEWLAEIPYSALQTALQTISHYPVIPLELLEIPSLPTDALIRSIKSLERRDFLLEAVLERGLYISRLALGEYLLSAIGRNKSSLVEKILNSNRAIDANYLKRAGLLLIQKKSTLSFF